MVVAVTLTALVAGAESLCAAFDRKTGLTGSEYWAGLKRHPAVVNPVGRVPSPNVMSLAGEWEFTTFNHASGKRTVFLQEKSVWPKVRKIQVPGCWQAQGVGGVGKGTPGLCQDNSPKMNRGISRRRGWRASITDLASLDFQIFD